MKTLLSLMLALSVLPAHAQLYKWTDANGKVHFSDRPQDGANIKAVQVQQAQAAPANANDNWRERERASRESRMQQESAERSKKVEQALPHSAMSGDEACASQQEEIDFAEQTKTLAAGGDKGKAVMLTEAQRQDMIRARKAHHAIACGKGARR
jgi:hypothetical protein